MAAAAGPGPSPVCSRRRVRGGGEAAAGPPQLQFFPSTVRFGSYFCFLAAPSSWPINIYIYLYPKNERRGGRGSREEEKPLPSPPSPPKINQTADSKCSETVFGCHQTRGDPEQGGGDTAPGTSHRAPGQGWGAAGEFASSSSSSCVWGCPVSPLPRCRRRPRLDEGDPYGNAG